MQPHPELSSCPCELTLQPDQSAGDAASPLRCFKILFSKIAVANRCGEIGCTPCGFLQLFSF
jgi:hypothetical protein